MKPRTAPVKTDADFLQGSWAVSSLEVDGESMSPDMLAEARVEIQGNRFRSVGMGAVFDGIVTLDPDARPKAFDLAFTKGPEKGNTNLGIYELDGDGWRLCLATRGDARPKKFAAKANTGHALETLRRGAAATKAKAARIAAPAAAKSLTELEGEWSLVSGFLNGKPMDEVTVQYGLRSFQGNRTVLKFGPQTYIDALFTLDPSQSPHAIDYSHTGGMYAGKTQLGIYECDGKTLKLSSSPPGRPRPTGFAERGDHTVTVFRKR
ncbi:MAG TPA: TIGR03067 domain-containing protein [Candidatus Sulfopaludibacter sp.]|nr:TIGR03067 domain-containing protein [Candidatus Sulfopaludibacter sp.]